MVESEPPEDIGILFEWLEGDKPRAVDCGEIRDLELYTDQIPLSIVVETEGKKEVKKPVDKSKKKDAIIFEPHKKYKGFFEYSEDDVKIDQPFAEILCSRTFRVQIVNTDEMKVLHEAKLDYSSLLLHHNPDQTKYSVCFEQNIYYNHSQFPWLSSLSMRIETNKTLLKPEYKLFLNPIMINIAAIENLYLDPSRKSPIQPLMIKYDFLKNGKPEVATERIDTKEDIYLGAKHVFLMGLEKQIDLKEHLESHRIEVEVHDRDEIRISNLRKSVEYIEMKEPEPVEEEETDPKKKKKTGPGGTAVKKPEPVKKKEDPKKDIKKKKDKKKEYVFQDFQPLAPVDYYQREFGVAQFFLKALLNPYSLHYDLQAIICPKRVFVDEDRANLNLNQTARKKGRDTVKATDYFTKVNCIVT